MSLAPTSKATNMAPKFSAVRAIHDMPNRTVSLEITPGNPDRLELVFIHEQGKNTKEKAELQTHDSTTFQHTLSNQAEAKQLSERVAELFRIFPTLCHLGDILKNDWNVFLELNFKPLRAIVENMNYQAIQETPLEKKSLFKKIWDGPWHKHTKKQQEPSLNNRFLENTTVAFMPDPNEPDKPSGIRITYDYV